MQAKKRKSRKENPRETLSFPRIIVLLIPYCTDMPTITLTRCPACGNPDIQEAFNAIDHFSSGESFPLFDCNQCGLRFTNGFPSEEAIGRYYDSADYISHSDTDEGWINKLYHLARRYMLKRKLRMVRKHMPPTEKQPSADDPTGSPRGDNLPVKRGGFSRLLDMGCGTGYFLNAAKEAGYAVTGIEKDAKAREYAAHRFGLPVMGEESFWNLTSESFEAVTLWHVLEHLEKLEQSISKVTEVLVKGGVAVIAVPNYRSFDAAFYEAYWAAYDVPRHLWHFSPYALEQLLKKHGLTVIQKQPMPFDAFYISLLSEQYKKSRLLTRYGRAFLVGLSGSIAALFRSEKASSIVYIARKEGNERSSYAHTDEPRAEDSPRKFASPAE